jgi:hypothetical protein
MTELENRDGEPALSPREQARLRRRDRKRRTAMVVDNEGVKQVLQAQRTREEARKARQGAASGAAGGSRTGGSSQS